MSKHEAPFALPVKAGAGERGYNANLMTDANGDSIAQFYSIPINTIRALQDLRFSITGDSQMCPINQDRMVAVIEAALAAAGEGHE